MNKYEFTGKVLVFYGRELKQIKASISFGNIKVGEIGGWIEKDSNLSAEVSCDAWVSGDAKVYGNAEVYGNAKVYGDAWVSGNVKVSGDAEVSGNAKVYGDAWVSGDAKVSGNAEVSGNAKVYGNAEVSGNAWVSGNVKVSGDAWVSGDAKVYGNAEVSGNASKTPISISGLYWNVIITDKHIRIGCQFHLINDWKSFIDSKISGMAVNALDFWNKYKLLIICLADAHEVKDSEQ